ncbi:MAG: cobalamin biosynthesis protein [Spongiibacteraceae bacterium]
MNTEIYYAGFGCRRGCPEESLRELLEQSLHEQCLSVAQLSGLASIDSKHDEAGLCALARSLNLPLVFFSAAQLSIFANRCGESAPIILQTTGVANVAEASALALAETHNGQHAELMIRKRKSSDATVALARTLGTTQKSPDILASANEKK